MLNADEFREGMEELSHRLKMLNASNQYLNPKKKASKDFNIEPSHKAFQSLKDIRETDKINKDHYNPRVIEGRQATVLSVMEELENRISELRSHKHLMETNLKNKKLQLRSEKEGIEQMRESNRKLQYDMHQEDEKSVKTGKQCDDLID